MIDGMHRPRKFGTKDEACKLAKEQSENFQSPYQCVIYSEGMYYVEDGAAFIRNWETLIAEYREGELTME